MLKPLSWTRLFLLCLFFTLPLAEAVWPQSIQELTEADFKAMRLILSEQDRKAFDRLNTLDEKREWARIYWKRRDPTPTTDQNERYEEFIQRLKYVRQWFSAPSELGFDDRGRIYLRYGEPTERFVQPIGELNVKPNESWSYSGIYPGLVFDFVSRGTYYRLVDDLSQALGARTEPAAEMENLINLYDSRTHLDPRYERIASELRRALSVDMSDYGARSDPRNLRIGNLNLARQEMADIVNELQRIRTEAPKVVYRHDYKKKPLAIAHSLARFRAPDGRVRVELYYGIPYNQLQFEPRGQLFQAPLIGSIAVFDSSFRRLALDSINTRLLARNAVAMQRGAFISQFNFRLAPGKYHLAIRFENPAGNRLGILRAEFTCPLFPDDALAMSDLQLSPQIVRPHGIAGRDSVQQQRMRRFIKHGLRVMPLPGLTIDKSRMLYVYFEIYNLQADAGGKTQYELEYSLRDLAEKKGLIRRLFGGKKPVLSVVESRSGRDRNPIEYIGIDLSQQKPGKYRLQIVVRDKVSGQKVQASVPVNVVQRAG
ncbi:MAG: GWxTD domain-containing protein [candidate division KSB1 bacterium]|nr:GWxTD domain-containing protein [candidate division KSB1 bacterium]